MLNLSFSATQKNSQNGIQASAVPLSSYTFNKCYNDLNNNFIPNTFKSLVQSKLQNFFSLKEDRNVHKITFKSVKEDFYNHLANILAMQKACEKIISIVKEKYNIASFEKLSKDNFLTMLEETLKSINVKKFFNEHLREQKRDFLEIQKMISTLFKDKEIKESLIRGGKEIYDLAAGRGELAIALLFEIHLERLQLANLSLHTDLGDISSKFNALGIKPNSLTLIEPLDYSSDMTTLLKSSLFIVKDAFYIFNNVKTINALLQEIEYPKDSIIVSHRACGTLSDDMIKSFNKSKASLLLVMPCCLHKAYNEATRYGISQEKWNKICKDADNSFFKSHPKNQDEFITYLKNYTEAWNYINNKRLHAFLSDIDASIQDCGLKVIIAKKRKH